MNRLFRMLCLCLLVMPLTFSGCGGEEPGPELNPENDPALSSEGNPSADASEKEVDPAL